LRSLLTNRTLISAAFSLACPFSPAARASPSSERAVRAESLPYPCDRVFSPSSRRARVLTISSPGGSRDHPARARVIVLLLCVICIPLLRRLPVSSTGGHEGTSGLTTDARAGTREPLRLFNLSRCTHSQWSRLPVDEQLVTAISTLSCRDPLLFPRRRPRSPP